MIFLVYSCIAPLVSVVVGLCFAALGALFRHQFVYIYARNPDSGGYLWLNFIQILTTCLLIAEITVVGMLALKKATIATPLMFPLIIATALFSFYIRQEHFHIAQYLPTRLSLRKDSRNSNIDIDYAFVQEAYLQPELRERVFLPELSNERITELGIRAMNEINISKVDDDEEAAASAIEDDSLGSGPPICVIAKNAWMAPHETVLRKGLSCRALVIGTGDEGRFEDVSMVSED
jgi:hypothetical protein